MNLFDKLDDKLANLLGYIPSLRGCHLVYHMQNPFCSLLWIFWNLEFGKLLKMDASVDACE